MAGERAGAPEDLWAVLFHVRCRTGVSDAFGGAPWAALWARLPQPHDWARDPRHRPWLPVLPRRHPDDLCSHRIDPLSVPGLGGAALLVVQTLIAPPLLLAGSETSPDIVAMERAILTEGGFLDAILLRSMGFAFIMPSLLVIQGIAALGWFCLGLAAVKSGMIDDAGHPLWRRARRWCLVPGVVIGLFGAAIWQWGPPVPGVVFTIAFAPVGTLGYLGLIAALSRTPGPIMAKALKAGGSSLSIYLGQSIILTTIFSGYGLDLWRSVDRLTAVVIGVAVTSGLIGALLIWRFRFALGPFEWVLRRITYLGFRV